MTSEAVKGLNRLRNAAILSLFAYLLLVPLLRVATELVFTYIPARVIPVALLAEVPALLVLLVVMGLLMLVAWISRVLGWWSMRKLGWRRKFYTAVWLTVLLGSVVAFFLILTGAVIAVLGALLLPLVDGAPAISLAGSAFIVAGILIMALATLIEGVASLDVGLRTNAKLLGVGSAVYVAAALAPLLEVLTVARVVGLVAYALLAIGLHETRMILAALALFLEYEALLAPLLELLTVAMVASLVAYLLLAIGFHQARKGAVAREAQ